MSFFVSKFRKGLTNIGRSLTGKTSNKSLSSSEIEELLIDIRGLRIFISYRRTDSQNICGRIYDRLMSAPNRYFSVFKDVDAIPIGTDFRHSIESSIQKSDVLLVIIGNRWTSTISSNHTDSTVSSEDFVRIEIELAIKYGIPIIPVLVDFATMPKVTELPQSIAELSYRTAILVRPDPDFSNDMEKLMRQLDAMANTKHQILRIE
ncbi:MAG: toll/interleukin-1 receptor domain-containing protein [Cyanobacteria bacterium P01_F01_bin.53]